MNATLERVRTDREFSPQGFEPVSLAMEIVRIQERITKEVTQEMLMMGGRKHESKIPVVYGFEDILEGIL